MTTRSSHPFEGHGSLFWLTAVALPCVAFLAGWGLYQFVIGTMHYSLGILVSLLVAGVSFAFIAGAFDKDPLARADVKLDADKRGKWRVTVFVVTLSTSIASVLLLITFFAWVSYALLRAGVIEATVASSSPATYSSFVATYGWHLVDLMPGMNVEKTLGMGDPPVQWQGWIAAFPVLTYRLLVGVVAFTAIRRAWNKFTEIDARLDAGKETAGDGHPGAEG